MEGPFGHEIKHYADQCSYCHWHMEGEVVIRPGERGVPVWCGAGRDDYFMTGRTCPSRLPWVEVRFDMWEERDKGPVWATFENGRGMIIADEVLEWIAHNVPKTIVERSAENVDTIVESITMRFDRPEDFVLFKLFWL